MSDSQVSRETDWIANVLAETQKTLRQSPMAIVKQRAYDEGYEAARNDLATQKVAEVFAAELGQSIMIALATLPFDQWPEVARTAFNYHKQRTPTPAYFYRLAIRQAGER